MLPIVFNLISPSTDNRGHLLENVRVVLGSREITVYPGS